MSARAAEHRYFLAAAILLTFLVLWAFSFEYWDLKHASQFTLLVQMHGLVMFSSVQRRKHRERLPRYPQILTTDAANYSWYQGHVMEQAQRVSARQGIAFLSKVRAAFPSGARRFALGNAQTLHRLDAIDSSFSAWAKSLVALPRASKSTPHREKP